jgi:hypothetical protein
MPELLTTFDNGLHFFSPAGRMIAETPDLNRLGRDFSHREYFRKTIESGKPYISEPPRSYWVCIVHQQSSLRDSGRVCANTLHA